MDKLLPCPFCGGEAELERMGDRRQSCIVSCTWCGCSHESSDEDENNGKSWNTRHTPEGWQLVPVDPTDGMIMGGHHQIDWVRPNQNTHYPEHESHIGSTCKSDMTRAYKRMLAAAPKWGGE